MVSLAVVKAYPDDEILLVWDEDFEYGEEFYFCSTKKSADVIVAMLAVILIYREHLIECFCQALHADSMRGCAEELLCVQERAPKEEVKKSKGAGGEGGAAGEGAGGDVEEEEEEDDEEYPIPEVREGPLIPRPWSDLGTEQLMQSAIVPASRVPTKIEFFRK